MVDDGYSTSKRTTQFSLRISPRRRKQKSQIPFFVFLAEEGDILSEFCFRIHSTNTRWWDCGSIKMKKLLPATRNKTMMISRLASDDLVCFRLTDIAFKKKFSNLADLKWRKQERRRWRSQRHKALPTKWRFDAKNSGRTVVYWQRLRQWLP